jgi:uncharacterized protein (TIGR02118 family)
MIKVMWFLKRAEHLTLEEFHHWWMEVHVPVVVKAHGPYLKKYVVNLRWPNDPFPGKPREEMDWDGVAEQWFETDDDFIASCAPQTDAAARQDTLKHTSRHARMILHENLIELSECR